MEHHEQHQALVADRDAKMYIVVTTEGCPFLVVSIIKIRPGVRLQRPPPEQTSILHSPLVVTRVIECRPPTIPFLPLHF